MISKVFRSIGRIAVFFRGYWLRAFGVMVLTVMFSFLEGFGLSIFIPLFGSIFESDGAASQMERLVLSVIDFLHFDKSLLSLTVLIAAVFIVRSVLQYLSLYLKARLSESYLKDIRRKMFAEIFGTDWEFYISRNKGYLINDLVLQTAGSKRLFYNMLGTVFSFTTVFTYLAVAFMISKTVTMVSFFLVVLLMYFILPLIRMSKKYGEKGVRASRELTSLAEQYLTGFRNLKSYNAVSRASVETDKQIGKEYSANLAKERLTALMKSGIEMLAVVLVLTFLYVSLKIMGLGFEEVGVISILFLRSFQRSGDMLKFNKIAQQLPGLDVISSTREGFRNNPDRWEEKGEVCSFTDEIALKGIHFGYRIKGEKESVTLKNIDFKIGKGQMLGIVGGSGAGKTTLIDILLGLLEPGEGDILIDGIPLKRFSPESWRDLISYVPQDSFLLNDTIRSNISFFRDMERERIVGAAKLANAHDFIMRTENGYETVIGEMGTKLSGGQRQRVVLARALAREPEILILDEATSELDSESEAKIQEAVEGLKGDVTIIAVAHRLSTILKADNILVMEGGIIIEQGTKEELLSLDGRFKELYRRQMND